MDSLLQRLCCNRVKEKNQKKKEIKTLVLFKGLRAGLFMATSRQGQRIPRRTEAQDAEAKAASLKERSKEREKKINKKVYLFLIYLLTIFVLDVIM